MIIDTVEYYSLTEFRALICEKRAHDVGKKNGSVGRFFSDSR